MALLTAAAHAPAAEPAAAPAADRGKAEVPVRLSWLPADHPSGFYHIKSTANITIFADNVSEKPAELSGDILFGQLEPSDQRGASAQKKSWKLVSVTPIAPSTLAPGQRARIAVAVTFAGAGDYSLRWKQGTREVPLDSAAEADRESASHGGLALHCIFAPRVATPDTPWLAMLPRDAVGKPGYLADFMKQTTIRRFLLDERFAFDPGTGVGLGFGASLMIPTQDGDAAAGSAAEVDSFLAEAARARASLVLRLTVPLEAPDPRTLAAFKEYLPDAIRRAKGALAAVALAPEAASSAELTPGQRAAFQTYYLAAYASAKKIDNDIVFLGAGSAQRTNFLLGPELRSDIDALALCNASTDAAAAVDVPGSPASPVHRRRALSLWILPPAPSDPLAETPSAAALAQNAVVVPVPPPQLDHGVAAHLLNGTVFIQRTYLASLHEGDLPPIPFLALFQGDGYALAAIAGPGAGTDADTAVPGLAHSSTQVDPLTPDEKPAYPNLEVSDDTRAMRVVDHAGGAIDCRVGDSLYVPVSDRMVYLLQAGRADDLAGSLRPATPHRLPFLDVSAGVSVPAARAAGADELAPRLILDVRNIQPADVSAKLRLLLPAKDGQSPVVLGVEDLPPLVFGKHAEFSLPLTPEQLAAISGLPLVVEATMSPAGGKTVIQRTAISLRQQHP